MEFDFAFALEILPELLYALRITILATILGMAFAAVVGMVWAVARIVGPWWIAAPVRFIVQFLRSTPLLVQIYFLYYIFPEYGLKMNAFTTGVLALGLHYSAYLAEVYRAGIEAVPRGQWEAATALDLTPARTWRNVILPQAVPPILPVMGNYLIAMFKDTPLLSAITVLELLQTAKIIGSETFRYLEPLTLVGILFLVVSLAAAAMIRWAERRFNLQATRA